MGAHRATDIMATEAILTGMAMDIAMGTLIMGEVITEAATVGNGSRN